MTAAKAQVVSEKKLSFFLHYNSAVPVNHGRVTERTISAATSDLAIACYVVNNCGFPMSQNLSSEKVGCE